MDRKPVKSSNVQEVGYDTASQKMHVQFKGGSVYEYFGVPAAKHAALMASDSPGGYLAQHIRGLHKFQRLS